MGSEHDKDRALTFAVIAVVASVAGLILAGAMAVYNIFGSHNTPQIEVAPPTSITVPAK